MRKFSITVFASNLRHIASISASLVPSARSSSINLPARTPLIPAKPRPFERVVDCLALRVEDAGFQGDEHAPFQDGLVPLIWECRSPMAGWARTGKLYAIFTVVEATSRQPGCNRAVEGGSHGRHRNCHVHCHFWLGAQKTVWLERSGREGPDRAR